MGNHKDDFTKVITGTVLVTYVHMEKPFSYGKGNDNKYSLCAIISKDDYSTLAKINEAINNAIQLGYENLWANSTSGEIQSPLKDGQVVYPNKPEFNNSMYINATSKMQPGLVGVNKENISDYSEIYSGCYCKLSLNFYPYIYQGKLGVAVNLNNVMKVSDGKRLSVRKTAQEDFADE